MQDFMQPFSGPSLKGATIQISVVFSADVFPNFGGRSYADFLQTLPPQVLEVKLCGLSVGVSGGNSPRSFWEESSQSFWG